MEEKTLLNILYRCKNSLEKRGLLDRYVVLLVGSRYIDMFKNSKYIIGVDVIKWHSIGFHFVEEKTIGDNIILLIPNGSLDCFYINMFGQ